MNLRPGLIGLTSLLLLAPAAVTGAVQATAAPASTSASPQAAKPDKPTKRYAAKIRITKHGIPHIQADDFASLGYGAGWATTAAATCNLMDTLLTARGQRSLRHGPSATYSDRVGGVGTNLQWDTLVTDLRDRRVVERLLADEVAGPSKRAKAMVRAEAVGINRWLRTHEITDPACAKQQWIRPDVTTKDIWYAVYLAQLIGSTTRFLREITDAAPPAAGQRVATPSLSRAELAHNLGADESTSFGSNATAVGGSETTTGRGMLLGNPHFPWLGRYRFTQLHLTIPGRFDAAGASLLGSPVINIGFNEDVAWSHTVSTGYRFTPYQYTTAGSPTSYETEDGVRRLERRRVEVEVRTDDGVKTVTRTLYRTPQGYVFNSPSQYMTWTKSGFWAMRDANAEHLRILDTFLSMAQASDVRDLLRRQDRGGGMPWVNTIAADRGGEVLYADHSVIPHVTDEMADECMTDTGRLIFGVAGLPGLDGTRADGECAWGTDRGAQRPGILGPEHLPEVVTDSWVMNANDSYWAPNARKKLEGYPRIIGCEKCERSMRTKVVMRYVRDQLKDGKESPATLRSHQYANRVYAAEVARAGGRLDRVCAATGLTAACQVLRDWDGRSDTTSVGTAIFQEFMRLAGADKVSLWEVPFSAKHPFTTPRTLSTAQPVVDTMAKAIKTLTDRGIDLRAPYGSMHQSADRGDEGEGIGVSGGLGNTTGDANAVSSSGTDDPVVGGVNVGSSYIQAIAFRGKREVEARTVLTYGQYENPSSPWSNDQTRIFSDEGWVAFAWTESQIEKDLVRTVRISD
ncbi:MULTISPECIES: penicillin acylase family protein [unclassified Nocardioides]|uniref:penicillin acylase family protein n=1 Tax=unclassified Nocardioides TaxID=2615069 RepID=UPI00361090AB